MIAYLVVTMKARELFERASPTEAPPKPGVKPSAPPVERPGRPPAPGKHPNPFRRRRIGTEPGPMPRPKACVESEDELKALFDQPDEKWERLADRMRKSKASAPAKKLPGRNSYSQRISRAQSMLAKERIKHHDREIQKMRGSPLVSVPHKPRVAESAKTIIRRTQ